MTQRCDTCQKGFMEINGHFYECDHCGADVFVDDYSDRSQMQALGRTVTAAIAMIAVKAIPGENTGLKKTLNDKILDYKASVIRGIEFQGRLRPTWSASQITDWLNEQAEFYDRIANSDDDINHYVAAIHRELIKEFPSMLRKMWTSREVHEWLENIADNTQINYDK